MNQLLEQFRNEGWVRIDLFEQTPLLEAREALREHLCSLTGEQLTLEEYHSYPKTDEQHIRIQSEMTEFYREQQFGKKIIGSELNFFKELVGIDLLIQRDPYLRMARPRKPQDNVGYHRDTFYGGSPYEISVILPFVSCDEDMTLRVLPGSHVSPESQFSLTAEVSEDVTKGSEKHKLGFLYAPKHMDPAIDADMQPVPLKLGQILCFSLAIVHGSVENKGAQTRWTSDVRLLNALAPVDLTGRPTYYEPCHVSPLTASAEGYLLANAE